MSSNGNACRCPAAEAIVDALLLARVEERHIHIVAREGTELEDLPEAGVAQRSDLIQLLAIAPVSVARLLGEFRREGLIEEEQRRCTAMDTARLAQIATAQA